MVLGGGDIRWTDRLRDSSTCAFFECERARFGIAGVSNVGRSPDVRVPAIVADLLGALSKKPFSSSVLGVMGDDSIDELSADVLGVLRKARSAEKSESPAELMDEPDESEGDPETLRTISGYVWACTLVVEINSVGSEICVRSMRPWSLTLPPGGPSLFRLAREVSARAREKVEDAISTDFKMLLVAAG
jgi:hypothetical protein